MNTDEDVVTHESPAWRDRANFIIMAKIITRGKLDRWKREQLWARQLANDRFEICCIPFFIYDLALGDEVQTRPRDSNRYVIEHVVKQSGHYTFRVWFLQREIKGPIIDQLVSMSCLTEQRWSSSNLLAVDAPNAEIAQQVADLLYGMEQEGFLKYETGRLH